MNNNNIQNSMKIDNGNQNTFKCNEITYDNIREINTTNVNHFNFIQINNNNNESKE